MKALPIFLILAWCTSCALVTPTSSPVKYSEDLKTYRPEIQDDTVETPDEQMATADVEPVEHDNNPINRKLSALNNNNRRSGTTAGYTIQVYSGTSRDLASRAKAKVYRILPESRPETKYEQPIYKVRVGQFGDRLEAQASYAELLQEFPEAAVIPARIKIN